ncbi:hypothetical protein FRC16_001775 [Serendipita sp. 398]|nr:hypothetical protein FRC16_001775 [Serendipita sp. 398]
MRPIRIQRRIPIPQASPTSTPTTSSPISTASTSNSSPSTSSTASWDTRAGTPVFSTNTPRPTPTASDEHHSNGFLSSKIGVASLCAGIAVACLLLAGFLVYKYQARKLRARQQQAHGSRTASVAPSHGDGAHSSKAPPSPFQLKSRSRHPQDEAISTPRNSSSRGSRNASTTASRTALTESGRASQYPGQSVEVSPMPYQHTSTTLSRSATSQSFAASAQRRLSTEQSVGSTASIVGASTMGAPHQREESRSPPFQLQRDNSFQSRMFLDRHSSLATATSSRTSMPESTINNSRTHLLLPGTSSVNATPIIPVSTGSSAASTLRDARTFHRPLPAPPHPPPAYEAINTLRHPLSPIPALSTSTVNLSLTTGDRKEPLPSADNVVSHSTGLSTVSSAPRQEYPYVFDPVTGVLISSSAGPVADATLTPSGDAVPGEGEEEPQHSGTLSASSHHTHRTAPPPFSSTPPPLPPLPLPPSQLSPLNTVDAHQDPFAHPHDDLPAWLHSDPFPVAHGLRHYASQMSIYGGPARSVAASSHVLPSPTNSARSLSPEPPLTAEIVLRATPGVRASASSITLATALTRRPPPPAPATRSTSLRPPSVSVSMASSARTQLVEGDGPPLEDVILNPGAERPGWAKSGSHLAASSSLSRNRRKVLPDHFDELEGPGLSRAFSIDSPRRGREDGNVINGLLRGRTINAFTSSLGVRTSNSIHRPSTAGAFTPVTSSGAVILPRNHPLSNHGSLRTSSYGDIGWLNVDPLDSRGGRINSGIAPPSRILSSDIDSIRSMSPEFGWIEGEDEAGTINEAKRVSIASKKRASRMSMGEGAILWGKLTSQLEGDARTKITKPTDQPTNQSTD